MKQRIGPVGPPNQGVPLSSDDFLTGEEVQQTQIPDSLPVMPPPVNVNMEQGATGGVPDLEKMEGTPNVNRRQEINKMIDLTSNILENKHPDSANEIKKAGSGYIAMYQLNQMLEIIAQTIEMVGAENFDSASLYDTAQSYSQVIDGTQRSSFSKTKRDAVDAYGIYEVRAIDRDIFRLHDDWIPTVREP